MTKRRFAGFVEALVNNRRPRAFRPTPEDAEAMRVAIELRAVEAEGSAPDPRFVRELHGRLAQDLDAQPMEAQPAEAQRVSRRWLLEGAGAAVAAGVVAGVAVAIDRTAFSPSGQPSSQPQEQPGQQELSPKAATWHTVTSSAALGEGVPTRFATPDTVGFITNDGGTLRAVSGVCT
ncbi:MAG: hypothetical protein ACRD1G_18995, partial [Acidimicrobiales bacterium]